MKMKAAGVKVGMEVRMPCEPDRWQRVTEVRRIADDCYRIACGPIGHNGEDPLEVREAGVVYETDQ
jgi:hypothetical protein